MAKKYHLGDDGQPRPCDAKISCPKGGEQDHFEGGIQDARSWAEEKNAEQAGGSFGNVSKEPESEADHLISVFKKKLAIVEKDHVENITAYNTAMRDVKELEDEARLIQQRSPDDADEVDEAWDAVYLKNADIQHFAEERRLNEQEIEDLNNDINLAKKMKGDESLATKEQEEENLEIDQADNTLNEVFNDIHDPEVADDENEFDLAVGRAQSSADILLSTGKDSDRKNVEITAEVAESQASDYEAMDMPDHAERSRKLAEAIRIELDTPRGNVKTKEEVNTEIEKAFSENELGTGISVDSDGSVSTENVDTPNDEFFYSDSEGNLVDYDTDWEPVEGLSNQYGYKGPIMDSSETVSAGVLDYIRENPGTYVASPVETIQEDDDDDYPEQAGWVLMKKK